MTDIWNETTGNNDEEEEEDDDENNDDNTGGSQPELSPDPTVTNCTLNEAGGFDPCLVSIPVIQAENLYNDLLWDYQVPIVAGAAILTLVGGLVIAPAFSVGVLLGVAVGLAVVAIDVYAAVETTQIGDIRSEIDDGLDNQIPGQQNIAFQVSQTTADSPIEFGWTGGTNPQTITSPVAQNIILDLIGLSQ